MYLLSQFIIKIHEDMKKGDVNYTDVEWFERVDEAVFNFKHKLTENVYEKDEVGSHFKTLHQSPKI